MTFLGLFCGFWDSQFSAKQVIYYVNKKIIETFMVFSFYIDFDLIQLKSLCLFNVKDLGAFQKLPPKSSFILFIISYSY